MARLASTVPTRGRLGSRIIRAILFFLLAIVLGPLIGGLGFYALLVLKAVGGLDPATTFPQNEILRRCGPSSSFPTFLD